MILKRVLPFLLICATTLFAAQEKTPYEKIAHHLLKSMNATKQDPLTGMTEHDRFRVALSILNQAEVYSGATHSRTLGNNAIEDLQLFFYNMIKPDYTVLNHVKRTQSVLGTCALARMLITPLTAKEDILMRRSCVTMLMQNRPLYLRLKALLQKFANLEERLLALWNPNDVVFGANMRETFFDTAMGSNNPHMLELNALYKDSMASSSWIIGFLIMQFFSSGESALAHNAPAGEQSYFSRFIADHPYVIPCVTLSLSILMSGSHAWNTMKNRILLMRTLRRRFATILEFKHLVEELEKISEEFNLSSSIPEVENLYDFTHNSSEVRSFLQTLEHPSFHTKNAYLLSRKGNVLAALPRFVSLRSRFSSALQVVAQLDAALSIADLYVEYAPQAKSYCFPEYLFEQKRPIFHAHGAWHAMLPPHVARASSLPLGQDFPQNVIITGPNAGGKSTNIKALVLSALFAQTLTIAPCQELRITPFHVINTYLNVIDDISSGRSQHRSEAVRGRQLINDTLALKENQFALTSMDEMFRSTVPATGAAASFAVAKGLAKLPNSMLILATHFGKLTTLPEHTNHAFMNYRVTAHKNEDGSFAYPFTLEPGFNHKVIALDLLSFEGFNPEILASAYEHLKQLQTSDGERSLSKEADAFVTELQHFVDSEIEKKHKK